MWGAESPGQGLLLGPRRTLLDPVLLGLVLLLCRAVSLDLSRKLYVLLHGGAVGVMIDLWPGRLSGIKG